MISIRYHKGWYSGRGLHLPSYATEIVEFYFCGNSTPAKGVGICNSALPLHPP